MPHPPGFELQVSHASDVGESRRLAKALAGDLGFSANEIEELAIVVSELTSNLVKHTAGGGLIKVSPVEDETGLGIRLESLDNGPGINDVGQAIADGFSTAGSLGCGLGAINRLCDEFEIQPRADGKTGTQITCLRWRREPIRKAIFCPLSFGVATRAYRNMEYNGDSFVIKTWNKLALVALIDGLGHGQNASQAASTTREYIEKHYDRPLESLFRGVGRACHATRGVVMALAQFDCNTAPIKLTFASIGNIEARVFDSPTPINLRVRRGVMGFNAPHPVINEYSWSPDNVLVLHTDGLKTMRNWGDFPELAGATVEYAAQRILQKLVTGNDDATVIVVRKNHTQSGDSL